jgi:YfiR/HmsC-like
MRKRPTSTDTERHDSAEKCADESARAQEKWKKGAAENRALFPFSPFPLSSLVALLVLFHGVLAVAEPPQSLEYQVKGAFLVKFAMFVEWPAKTFPDAQTPITIGLLGDDPFGSEFESALKKEVANGRPFCLKRFKSSEALTDCQMLFINASESQRLPEILDATHNKAILVIGDHERFAHQGGMINFIKEGNKVRFEVNTVAIEASGLKISAKLLQVAKPVTPDVAKEKP